MKRNSSNAKRNKLERVFDYERLEPKQLLAFTAPNIGPTANTQLVDGFSEAEIQIIDQVTDYLNQQASTEYLQAGEFGLRPIQVQYGLASLTTRFQQTYAGLPIHNAIVTVNQGPDGKYQQIADNLAFEQLLTPVVASVC